MILLVLIASVLIAAVTIYQYNEEARDYHEERLQRKEKAIISDINYVIKETTYPVETEKIPLILKKRSTVSLKFIALELISMTWMEL